MLHFVGQSQAELVKQLRKSASEAVSAAQEAQALKAHDTTPRDQQQEKKPPPPPPPPAKSDAEIERLFSRKRSFRKKLRKEAKQATTIEEEKHQK